MSPAVYTFRTASPNPRVCSLAGSFTPLATTDSTGVSGYSAVSRTQALQFLPPGRGPNDRFTDGPRQPTPLYGPPVAPRRALWGSALEPLPLSPRTSQNPSSCSMQTTGLTSSSVHETRLPVQNAHAASSFTYASGRQPPKLKSQSSYPRLMAMLNEPPRQDASRHKTIRTAGDLETLDQTTVCLGPRQEATSKLSPSVYSHKASLLRLSPAPATEQTFIPSPLRSAPGRLQSPQHTAIDLQARSLYTRESYAGWDDPATNPRSYRSHSVISFDSVESRPPSVHHSPEVFLSTSFDEPCDEYSSEAARLNPIATAPLLRRRSMSPAPRRTQVQKGETGDIGLAMEGSGGRRPLASYPHLEELTLGPSAHVPRTGSTLSHTSLRNEAFPSSMHLLPPMPTPSLHPVPRRSRNQDAQVHDYNLRKLKLGQNPLPTLNDLLNPCDGAFNTVMPGASPHSSARSSASTSAPAATRCTVFISKL